MNTAASHETWQIIVRAAIGNLSEWYNFVLFGYLSLLIADLFFPSKLAPLTSLTLAFGVFAISFLARPFGSLIFGKIGDKYGRRRTLIWTQSMMAIATLGIACLPTYPTVGLLSPILLIILRIVQGMSVAGEITASSIYLSEQAPAHRKAFWVSAVSSTAGFGILFGSLVTLLLFTFIPLPTLLAGAWRLPFFLGAFLSLFAAVLRLRLPESKIFEELAKNKLPSRDFFHEIKTNKSIQKKFLVVTALVAAWGICYQLLYVWMPTYLVEIHHLKKSTGFAINSLYIFIFALLLPICGLLSDRIGHRKMILFSSAGLFLFSHMLFLLLNAGIIHLFIALSLLTLLFANYLISTNAFIVQIFASDIRSTALSLSFNIALGVFGGTAPLIATWLIKLSHHSTMPAFYMMTSAFIAWMTIYFLPAQEHEIN